MALLTEKRFKRSNKLTELLGQSGDILKALLSHSRLPNSAKRTACEAIHPLYAREIRYLAKSTTGWHFSAHKVMPEDIDDFELDQLASDTADHAPSLSALLDTLLSAKKTLSPASQTMAADSDSDNDHESVDDDQVVLEGTGRTPPASPDQQKKTNQADERRKTLLRIVRHSLKRTVIFSILIQSSCQKANTFQSMFGVFLHACRTPEKVIETLAHMGISVSTKTIHYSIKSLSMNARRALQELGRTMRAAIAYDNVDIMLRRSVAVVEKSNENLRHLTSGLFFPLMHGVTREHLKYSKLLWEKSPFNPANANAILEKKTYFDLLRLMPDELDESGTTTRDRFVAWLYLRDLCTYGPEYFRAFRPHFADPEPIEAIPVVKTDILPAYAMEVNNSTTSGNIQAIDNLLEQGGILDP
ncbi:hypothetical protein JOM56_004146, partial [Amanita muscaria]